MKQEGIDKQGQKDMYYPNLSLFLNLKSENSLFYYTVTIDAAIIEQFQTKILFS